MADLRHGEGDQPRTNGTAMPLTLACPDIPTTSRPPLYSPDWHQQQADEERAWLDHYARTQPLPTTRTAR